MGWVERGRVGRDGRGPVRLGVVVKGCGRVCDVVPHNESVPLGLLLDAINNVWINVLYPIIQYVYYILF